MVLEEHRPTPEEILKKIRMIDPDETRVRQGRLKIFFGYAAGVGKTYAMLEMAHQMKDMGVDVVAGYIEPHIRPATMKLVEGLGVPSSPGRILQGHHPAGIRSGRRSGPQAPAHPGR